MSKTHKKCGERHGRKSFGTDSEKILTELPLKTCISTLSQVISITDAPWVVCPLLVILGTVPVVLAKAGL